jgi:regulator of extracellular matrix RemA (YlzA/DUF370 family)
MNYPFISRGPGRLVTLEKIAAIIPYDSSPSRRPKEEARKQGELMDATEVGKTRLKPKKNEERNDDKR